MSDKLQAMTILVVDDNQALLDMTRTLLARFGAGKVLVATDGDSGFRMFCENQPDIVISDWMMQPVDGIELVRRIRHDRASPAPTTPVILMTSLHEKQRILHARDQGATEFLPKPFGARDLYKRLMQVIERPRPFVETNSFYGPDRRRTPEGFSGPDRRGAGARKTVSFRFTDKDNEKKNEDPFRKIGPGATANFQLED